MAREDIHTDMGNVGERIRELKRRKEGIENVLTNLVLLPDEMKPYMEDLHDINEELADIDRQLLCYKMIKNCY